MTVADLVSVTGHMVMADISNLPSFIAHSVFPLS